MEKKTVKTADILEEIGCLGFINKYEDVLIEELERSVPDAFPLLDSKAVSALRKALCLRLRSLYIQPLMLHINKGMQRYDPVGMILGRTDPEALRKAAADVLHLSEESSGSVDMWLQAQYPLLEAYTQSVCDNTAAALREFLERVVSRKDDISSLLPEGKPFERITGLSTGGADMHRHGRCVIGVTTDAGVFYYKPHDCRIDALYERIVSKWFSDCTEAPRVLEGDGYAFISALVHTPVQSEAQIAEYYRNFGILTALFHGLGSNDMHQENVMACGARPSAIDLETVLNLNVTDRTGQDTVQQNKTAEEFTLSAMRIGVLPARIYRSGLISPLYCTDNQVSCLPVYDGKRITVEGYESRFAEGFSEGYERMLAHREEIKAMLDEYRGSTMRIVVRNTVYYAHICVMLHQAKYMVSEEARQKVYEMLKSPFTTSGVEPDSDLVGYEWKCVLQGDIPYYCTTLDSFDLCGEDPDEIVKQGYYKRSAIQATIHFLDRLSPEEKRFELDIIRTAFAHAPLDVPKPEGKTALAASPADKETLIAEVRAIYAKLKADTVRCTDGSPMWIGTAETLAGNMAVGRVSALCGVGRFLAELVLPGQFSDIRDEAMALSEECAERIVMDLHLMNEADLGTENPVFATGLFGGAGSQLLSLLKMSEAGIAGADEAVNLLIDALTEGKIYESKKMNSAEGSAGLIPALAAAAEYYKETDGGLCDRITRVLRSRTESLSGAQPPERADMPRGSAGYGAAFAAAYGILGEQKYAECAEKMFRLAEEEYSSELGGWRDFEAKSKKLADKGPHAAGIFLAADYAQERLGTADSAVSRVRELALSTMLSEENLYHADTLDEGNALTVLALLKAGECEAAGKVLEAMRCRAEKNGCYQVTEPGIRSFFDPSLIHGTLGCGAVMIRYIRQ
ncbi:MAG: DUF4135 domain-containing protein [Ruminiclostridium sp.]|nr:DUF4135 domain-containing protein [Ruminiclostridium sp.]